MTTPSSTFPEAAPGALWRRDAAGRALARTRFVSPPVVLALVSAAAAVFLYRQTRGTTLWSDEWSWVLTRRVDSVGTFLTAYQGHLSLVPLVIYRVLFKLFGLSDYRPYRALAVLGHLTCVWLVFAYARRRVGDGLAVLGAVLVLFLGPAWEAVLWPFRLAWQISVAAGIGALLALDRDDRPGDVLAAGLLGVSIASSGVGVAIALGALVDLGGRRRRPSATWAAALPLALYAIWWLRYQHVPWFDDARAGGVTSPVVSGVLRAPAYVLESLGSAVAALLGLGSTDMLPDDPITTTPAWAAALGLVVAGAIGWAARRRPGSWRLAALAAIALSFWALVALTNGFRAGPETGRYLYVGATFTVLAVAEAARGARVPPAVVLALALGAAAIVLSNVGAFRDGGAYLRGESGRTRAVLGALEAARGVVPPSFVPVGDPHVPVTAGGYFAAADALGSPAAAPRALAAQSPSARSAVDAELVALHGVAIAPVPAAVRLGAAPPVEAVASATVRRRGSCATFRPGPVTAGAAPASVVLGLPPAGVRIAARGAPARFGVRRFADGFRAVGYVRAGASGVLRIGADGAPAPWHIRLTSDGTATVCGLR